VEQLISRAADGNTQLISGRGAKLALNLCAGSSPLPGPFLALTRITTTVEPCGKLGRWSMLGRPLA
jgi:hypothetical protein